MAEITPKLTLYGATWCGGSRRVRTLLDEHQIPYHWVDIDKDEHAADIVEKITGGYRSVPTLVWSDGSSLVEPSNIVLANKLGINLP